MSDPGKAVFLSYASQDAEAAKRIRDALRAAGVDVWFDQSALRGGDAWDASIRRQIRECALFVPLVSANTQAREEGYFRLEWKLAVDRSHLMADDKAFLLPVTIDDTAGPDARVPDAFRARQWTRLPGGETPAGFCDDLKRLLGNPSVADPDGPVPKTAGRGAGISSAASFPPARMTRRSRWLAGAAAGALALLVGAVAVWNGLHSTGSGAPAAADAKRLSIVVLPFSNHTGDAGQDYFADGLTAALTADLSRIEDAFVIDSATAQSYRGKAQTAQQIGQALGVRFVLQGSVQRSGNQVRINTMLADSTTNKQLWSGSFDGETSNLFALQDQLTGRIANTMGRQIVVAAARESDKRGGAPQVVDLTLRARALEDKPHSLEKWEQVEQLYRQALTMDPGNVNVLAHLATALAFKTRHIRDLGLREKTWAEAIELSEKVIAIDPASPDPYRVLALRNLENDNLDAARRAAENYLRLGPRSPASYNVMGQVYSRLGELDKAVAMFRQAVDLSPAEVPAVFATNLGGAYFFQGNYRAAIDWNVRALQSEPNFWMAHLRLAMAYAMAGEESRARTEAAELLRLKPDFRIDVEKLRKEAENPARRALLEEKTIPAYRKAGLIE